MQKLLTDDAGQLQLHGPDWARGKMLTPRTLASRVLCKRHNGALSDLDEVGKQLAYTFQSLASSVQFDAGGPGVEAALRGRDVEKWMLKAFAGFLASGSAGQRRGPDPAHLEILFGAKSFSAPTGLYLVRPDRHDLRLFGGVGVDLLWRDGEVLGMRLALYGLVLALLVEPCTVPRHDGIRHPGQLWVFHGAQSRIDFRWPGYRRRDVLVVDASVGEPEIGVP